MKTVIKTLSMRTDREGQTTQLENWIVASPGWERKNLKPNTDYICAMIEVPSGYEKEAPETTKRREQLLELQEVTRRILEDLQQELIKL